MRDEQVRRYARHILLPDVGGLGQTALMVSTAKIELRESEPLAEILAALYLAAGGVGKLVLRGANPAQLANVAAHGADCKLETDGTGREISLSPRPAWWPQTQPQGGDATALAFWRGGLAALRWMADVANQ
jgi:adenylyltransferase/sulfurtransferase